MRLPADQQTVDGIRRLEQELVDERENVTLIDSSRVLAGPNGEYMGFAPGPDGQPVPVRRADSVHLHDAGAALLASEIASVIET